MQRLTDSTELNHAFDVSFLDISDPRDPGTMGHFDWINLLLGLKHATICVSRLLGRRPAIVYLGISQSLWGYLRDLTFIVPALCMRCRIVLHLRGSEFRTFYNTMPKWLRWITRAILRRTARVIVLGRQLTKIFDGLVDSDRIAVIPNGIRHEDYDIAREETRGDPRKRILFLSNLRSRKGVFLVIQAVAEVFRKHPDASISFAGSWRSLREEQDALALVSQLGIADRCRFIGEVTGNAKVKVYQRHDLFVFPPLEPEGLPWVILEAMSARLPVVTTDQGAITEVVEPGVTGFVANPTPSSVAEKICFLLDRPIISRMMGDAGYRRVVEQFSEQAYIGSLVGVFSEVIRSHPLD